MCVCVCVCVYVRAHTCVCVCVVKVAHFSCLSTGPSSMADAAEPQTSPSPQCDWSLCAICQERTNEREKCPANARQTSSGSTYAMLADNLEKFHSKEALTSDVESRLPLGPNLADVFWPNKAIIHDTCRLRYSASRLKRVKENPRCLKDDDEDTDSTQTEPAQKSACRTSTCPKFFLGLLHLPRNSSPGQPGRTTCDKL